MLLPYQSPEKLRVVMLRKTDLAGLVIQTCETGKAFALNKSMICYFFVSQKALLDSGRIRVIP